MKEFRFLEQKRVAGGLTPDEELRLAELRDLIGPDPAWTARPGFDVNAAAARLRESLGPARSGGRPAALALPFQEEDADALLDAALPGGPDPTAAYPLGEPAWSSAAAPAPGGSAGYGAEEPGWDPNAFGEPGAAAEPGVPYADAEPTWDPNAFAAPDAPAEPDPFASAEPGWDPNAFAAPAAPAEPGVPYADAEPSWDPNAFGEPGAAAAPGAPYADAEPSWDPDAFATPDAPAGPGAPYASAEPAWDPSAFATPAAPAEPGAYADTEPAWDPSALATPAAPAEPGACADTEPTWDPSAFATPDAPAEPGVPHADAEPSWDPNDFAARDAPAEPGVPYAGAEPAWREDPGGEAAATLEPRPSGEPGPPARPLLEELSLEDDPAAEPSAPPAPGDAAELPPEGFDAPAPPPAVPPAAPVLGEYDELAPAAIVRDAALVEDALEPLAVEAPSPPGAPTAPVLGEYDDTSGFEAPAGAFADGDVGDLDAALDAGKASLDEATPLPRTGVLTDPPPEAGEASFADLAIALEEPPQEPEADGALRLGFELESGGSFGAAADAAVPDWAREPAPEEAHAGADGAPPPRGDGTGPAHADHEPWAIDAPAAGATGPGATGPAHDEGPSARRAEAPAGGAEHEGVSPADRAEEWAEPPAAPAVDAEEAALAAAPPDDAADETGLAAPPADPPAPGALEPWAAEEEEILDIEEAGAVLTPDALPDLDPLPVPVELAEHRADDRAQDLAGDRAGGDGAPEPRAAPSPGVGAAAWSVSPGRVAPAEPALDELLPEGLPPLDLSTLSPAPPDDVSLDDLPTLEGDLLEELPSEELVPLPEPLAEEEAALALHAGEAAFPEEAAPGAPWPEEAAASLATPDGAAPADAAWTGAEPAADDAQAPGAGGADEGAAAATAPLARATQQPGAHRVVIHTAEGLTLRGLLEDPDLAAATLRLVPSDGGPPQELAAAGLKAIFFMVPPGEPPPPPVGRRIHVTFRDGRRVAGFSPDYADGAAGFFLHPAEPRAQTGRIWVYQAAVRQVAVG